MTHTTDVILTSGLFLGMPGLVMLIIVAVMIRRARRGARGTVRVMGVVVEHAEYMTNDSGLLYRPRYRATLPDGGATAYCVGLTSTSWKRPPLGTRVKLVYAPGDRENPLRESLVPVALVLTVAVLLVVGIGLATMYATVVGGALSSDSPSKVRSSPHAR